MYRDLLKSLAFLRKKAVRCKVWFSHFNPQERLLTDLMVKNVKIVKNKILAITISRLVVKLLSMTRHAFIRRVEDIGKPIVENMIKGALSIGWDNAVEWIKDPLITRLYGMQAYHSLPLRR